MRKVFILRGLPGSGKSTEANRLETQNNAIIVSADHSMIDEMGVYKFDPTKIGLAHATCMRNFINNVAGNLHFGKDVVVDNTNTTAVEIAPYIAVANAFGWQYEIKLIECDPEIAFSRQTHGVPRKTFDHMERNLKVPLPGYW